MATIYVGPTSAGAADGTSWANRYGSLNAAEDRPVAAGDTVYVGAGTYRETLTVDVSGSAGSPITYIGDYTGANTDGVGGVVRITGSDNDQTAVRNRGIDANAKHYRTFRGFVLDTVGGGTAPFALVHGTSCTDWVVEQCYLGLSASVGIDCNGAGQLRWTIQNCYVFLGQQIGIYLNHSGAVNNTAHVIQNCVFPGGYIAIYPKGIGGATVRNSFIGPHGLDGILANELAAGQTTTVNNSFVWGCDNGLRASTAGQLTENYNCLFGNKTARVNVTTGANSVAYPPFFDTRWFFELVGGGNMLTPFDLASYSQLVNLAGTSPTTTDMRGTSVIGAQREWGPLEYDPALLIEAGSGGGGPVVGSRIIRGLGAL